MSKIGKCRCSPLGLSGCLIHTVQQAEPITPQLLVRLSRVVNYKDTIEKIAWTATLLGFYMFLRKSNLVPEAMDKFDELRQFRRQDVNLMGPDRAMMFEVRWTKTLQFRQKILRFPVLPAKNQAICPVYWTHRMIQDNPGGPSDPLLLIHIPPIKLSLSSNQLIYRLRKWLKLVGENDMAYSLHSLCRGGATFAYQADLEAEMIKLLRGWASDCYRRYIDVSMDKRYDSMKAFVHALNNLTTE